MFRRVWLVALLLPLTLLSSFALLGAQQPQAPAKNDEVVATLGSRTITGAELDRYWEENDPGGYLQARQQMYEGRQAALEHLIADLLVEQAAKARGITKDQLLDEEIKTRLKPVTDADIQAIYEANKARLQGQTLEQVKERIQAFLGQQRPQEARDAFITELRTKAADLKVTLGPPVVNVAPRADDPVRGPASAPVRIVEFSDFQCPFCGKVAPTLQKLKETFGDKINVVFKDFPLPNHPLAPKAAEAGQCARVQDKFWEFHDKLFANQQALDVPSLKKHAVDLGLDAEKFNQCLDSGEMAASVQDDLTDGHRSGVSSTPAFFVNGRMVLGAQPYEAFETLIKDELARSSTAKF